MELKKLPSEGLKLLACLTMLMDHTAAVLGLSLWYRAAGRMAFPIYCFLLAEGAHYTKDPKKYGQRLILAMVLSEIPFDLVFRGRLTLSYQNVLLTLLLGFLLLETMKRTGSPLGKMAAAVPFLILGEVCQCDYGAQGIAMVLLFGLARDYGWSLWQMAAGLVCVSLIRPSMPIDLFGIPVPLELFSLTALLPIGLYSGRKATNSKWVQRAFYLFYPAHLCLLLLLK